MKQYVLAIVLSTLSYANTAFAADAPETTSSARMPKFICIRGAGGSITLNASNAENAVSAAQTLYFIVQDNRGQSLIGRTIDMTEREVTCSPAE